MSKSMRKVEQYVDAVRERDALRRAVKEGEGDPHAVKMAEDRAKEFYSRLTGGELGLARRILDPEPIKLTPEVPA